MLLTNVVRDAVFDGTIDLAFRRWQRPTVKAGGRLRTALGEVNVVSVDVVDPSTISSGEAKRAGFADADAVRHELFRERTGSGRARTARPTELSLVYRIAMSPGGADPRVALRSTIPEGADVQGLLDRLRAMDERSETGPWTAAVLGLIRAFPARRAPELAELFGLDTVAFKTRVRRLKELGLTESLSVGYRLSPRGIAVVADLNTTSTL